MLLSIFFALELLSSTSHAELISHITAEGGMVKYDLTKDPANGWYSEPNSSYSFKLGFKQGERTTPLPVLVATVTTTNAEHFRGAEALALKISAH